MPDDSYKEMREWFRTELQNHRIDMREELTGLKVDVHKLQDTLSQDIILTKVLEGKMKVWGSVVAALVALANAGLLLMVEVWKHGGKL